MFALEIEKERGRLRSEAGIDFQFNYQENATCKTSICDMFFLAVH